MLLLGAKVIPFFILMIIGVFKQNPVSNLRIFILLFPNLYFNFLQ
ncbi:unnamed protein product [Brassica rapa subsp. narinosa]